MAELTYDPKRDAYITPAGTVWEVQYKNGERYIAVQKKKSKDPSAIKSVSRFNPDNPQQMQRLLKMTEARGEAGRGAYKVLSRKETGKRQRAIQQDVRRIKSERAKERQETQRQKVMSKAGLTEGQKRNAVWVSPEDYKRASEQGSVEARAKYAVGRTYTPTYQQSIQRQQLREYKEQREQNIKLAQENIKRQWEAKTGVRYTTNPDQLQYQVRKQPDVGILLPSQLESSEAAQSPSASLTPKPFFTTTDISLTRTGVAVPAYLQPIKQREMTYKEAIKSEYQQFKKTGDVVGFATSTINLTGEAVSKKSKGVYNRAEYYASRGITPLVSKQFLATPPDQSKIYTDFARKDPLYMASQRVLYGATKKATEKPIRYIAVPAVSGFAFGAGTSALSAIGTRTATTVDVGGKLLAGAYFTSKGVKYASAGSKQARATVVGETALELTSFSFGATAGASSTIKGLGVIPYKSSAPRLAYSEVTLTKPTTSKVIYEGLRGKTVAEVPQETTIYRGLRFEQPSTGKSVDIVGYSLKAPSRQLVTYRASLVGRSASKTLSGETLTTQQIKESYFVQRPVKGVTVGTPKIRLDKYEGYSFAMESLSNPTTKNILLKSPSVSKTEKQKFSDIYSVAKTTYKKPPSSPYRGLEKVESFKTEEGFKYYISTLGKQQTFLGRKAAISYGFAYYKPQIKGETRLSGDVDTMLFKSEAKASKFAKTQAGILKSKYSEESFWKKDEPFLIQTTYGGRSHIGDIHPYGSDYAQAPETFFGVPYSPKTIKVSGTKGFSLAYGGLGKAASIATPTIGKGGRVKFQPEEYRAKDIEDFFVIQEELLSGGKSKEISRLREAYKPQLEAAKLKPEAKSPKVSFSYNVAGSPYTSSISPSVSPSRSVSRSVSASVSPSLSPSISPSVSPSRSVSRSVSASVSPSLSPSVSPSVSPSISPSPSPYITTTTTKRPPFPTFRFKNVLNKRVIKPIKRKEQPKAYTPSAFAIAFGIKGKTTKGAIKSGVGIRPIIDDQPKRKKLLGLF